jgi:translation elongation factor EF-4
LIKSSLDGSEFTYVYVSNPEDLPSRELYISIDEPIAKCEIITPITYV